jgi:hypothetical protein
MTIQDLQAAWKSRAHSKSITAVETARYIITWAALADSGTEPTLARLKRAFTPISSRNKLANGCTPFQSLELAVRIIQVHNGIEEDVRDMAKQLYQQLQIEQRLAAIAQKAAA